MFVSAPLARCSLRAPPYRYLRVLSSLKPTASRRAYVQGTAPGPEPDPHKTISKPPAKPQTRPAAKQTPRHEVHEGTAALNVPFNPPGGGGPTGGVGAGGGGGPSITRSPLVDVALTTVMGLGMVFVGGIAYLKWYKMNVLDKIEVAFAAGYDPALELATHASPKHAAGSEDEVDEDGPWTEHLRRREQDMIDHVIQGKESGHYFVLLGPKGSGKTTMIFDAMQAIQAEGVAMCDAHPDLEVFRLRLGKALNYEYNEDSQTGLFQRRDPREGGPALDIERAMNKLEKVALRSARRTGRPLVLIINNIHFFKNDDSGRNMLLQLQQRAEAWAASGILTLVLTSDDFWPYNVLRQSGNRMRVISIYDLDTTEALHASTRIRINARRKTNTPADVKAGIALVGGRLSYINKISKSKDMLDAAHQMVAMETAWLQSQIGLIEDCDDDVMDEQKWSSCSWLLLREFVRLREEQEATGSESADLPLPAIPFGQVRQIMTRTDFIEELDRLNIISIDVHHDVRPDSMLVLHAAREVVGDSGFDAKLDSVRARIDEIESLHRTRELTFKDVEAGDRIRLSVDKGGQRGWRIW